MKNYQYEYFEHKPYSIFDVDIPKQSLRDFEANSSVIFLLNPIPGEFYQHYYLSLDFHLPSPSNEPNECALLTPQHRYWW